MPEGVRGNMFVDLCETRNLFDGFLHGGFVKMVAAGSSSMRVFGKVGGGKEVLPDPVFVRIWVFAIQRVGQIYQAVSVRKVLFVNGLYIS